MRTHLALTMLLIAACAPSPAAGQEPLTPTCTGYCPETFLFGFLGHEYRVPGPGNTPALPPGFYELGDSIATVGFVTGWGGCIAPSQDPRLSEFTVHVVMGPVTLVQNYLQFWNYSMAGGRVRIYHDELAANGGTPGTYGTHPPNATVPSSFTDAGGRATLVLGGALLYPTYAFNPSISSGAWSATVEWDEGPLLDGLLKRQWTIASQFLAFNMPEGYSDFAQGEVRIQTACPAVPIHSNTWGELKTMYRH